VEDDCSSPMTAWEDLQKYLHLQKYWKLYLKPWEGKEAHPETHLEMP